MVETFAMNSPFVACDPCIERITHATEMKHYQKFWEHIVPARYRETDLDHKDFPKAIWLQLKRDDIATPGQSYFLYGSTGKCKTRIAVLLCKQAMLRNQHFGILWPEKLSTLKSGFDTATFDRYAEYDVLLCDDSLLTACREPKLVDSLYQLIDVRMRHNRPMIVTSQIGEEDMIDGKEFGQAKAADIERIKALIRRLRETCKIVPLSTPEATDTGSPY